MKKTGCLLAMLALFGLLTACGTQTPSVKAEAEPYLACVGKSREDVLTDLKLSEQSLSPHSVEGVDILEQAVRLDEQDFAVLLTYNLFDGEGNRLETPILASVEFVYSAENPEDADYGLANRLYGELKEAYGEPDPLEGEDSNEHFQLIGELKELRVLISGSHCTDAWSDIGHDGMQAVLTASLYSNQNTVPDAEDPEGTSYRLSVLFRSQPVIKKK